MNNVKTSWGIIDVCNEGGLIVVKAIDQDFRPYPLTLEEAQKLAGALLAAVLWEKKEGG